MYTSKARFVLCATQSLEKVFEGKLYVPLKQR